MWETYAFISMLKFILVSVKVKPILLLSWLSPHHLSRTAQHLERPKSRCSVCRVISRRRGHVLCRLRHSPRRHRHFLLTRTRNGRPSVACTCATHARCEITSAGATNVIDSTATVVTAVLARWPVDSNKAITDRRRTVDWNSCWNSCTMIEWMSFYSALKSLQMSAQSTCFAEN